MSKPSQIKTGYTTFSPAIMMLSVYTIHAHQNVLPVPAVFDGYKLDQGKCHEVNHCVKNRFLKGRNICEEYCSRRCKTCFKTKWDCVECADFYTMNKEGECVIENKGLSVFTDIRPLLNLLRRKGLKWMFMVVDDLWLYQYHKQDYDGIMNDVFRTISFVEEKQWEIVGLDEVLEDAKEKQQFHDEQHVGFLHVLRPFHPC